MQPLASDDPYQFVEKVQTEEQADVQPARQITPIVHAADPALETPLTEAEITQFFMQTPHSSPPTTPKAPSKSIDTAPHRTLDCSPTSPQDSPSVAASERRDAKRLRQGEAKKLPALSGLGLPSALKADEPTEAVAATPRVDSEARKRRRVTTDLTDNEDAGTTQRTQNTMPKQTLTTNGTKNTRTKPKGRGKAAETRRASLRIRNQRDERQRQSAIATARAEKEAERDAPSDVFAGPPREERNSQITFSTPNVFHPQPPAADDSAILSTLQWQTPIVHDVPRSQNGPLTFKSKTPSSFNRPTALHPTRSETYARTESTDSTADNPHETTTHTSTPNPSTHVHAPAASLEKRQLPATTPATKTRPTQHTATLPAEREEKQKSKGTKSSLNSRASEASNPSPHKHTKLTQPKTGRALHDLNLTLARPEPRLRRSSGLAPGGRRSRAPRLNLHPRLGL